MTVEREGRGCGGHCLFDHILAGKCHTSVSSSLWWCGPCSARRANISSKIPLVCGLFSLLVPQHYRDSPSKISQTRANMDVHGNSGQTVRNSTPEVQIQALEKSKERKKALSPNRRVTATLRRGETMLLTVRYKNFYESFGVSSEFRAFSQFRDTPCWPPCGLVSCRDEPCVCSSSPCPWAWLPPHWPTLSPPRLTVRASLRGLLCAGALDSCSLRTLGPRFNGSIRLRVEPRTRARWEPSGSTSGGAPGQKNARLGVVGAPRRSAPQPAGGPPGPVQPQPCDCVAGHR